MADKINGRTPEEIKIDLLADYGCCSECQHGKTTHDNPYSCAERALKCQVAENALTLIQQLEAERDELLQKNQQLERERDELKNKPMAWEDVIMSDSFLEVKDEYVGAALLQCAFSHDEYCADDEVTFTTHLNDLKIYYRSEYGKSWRCWPRFPTDEERAAAKWELNERRRC